MNDNLLKFILFLISTGVGSGIGIWLTTKFYAEPELDKVIEKAKKNLSRRF